MAEEIDIIEPIFPETSHIGLKNNDVTPKGVKVIDTTNASPGQFLVLYTENAQKIPLFPNNIYLISTVNPQPDPAGGSGGNIGMPIVNSGDGHDEFDIDKVAVKGFNRFKLKNDLVEDTTNNLNIITKTFVTLMFDGRVWAPISIQDIETYENP